MKAGELAALLNQNPDLEVMVLDGFNGAGIPREINLGPKSYVISQSDGEEAADCEEKVGDTVLIIGFGCY